MDTRAAAPTLTADEISALIETFEIAQKNCFPCLGKTNSYIKSLHNIVAQSASGGINEQGILSILTLAYNSLKSNDKSHMLLASLTAKVDPRIVAAVNQGLALTKGNGESIQGVIANVIANPDHALQLVLSVVSLNTILTQAKKLGVSTGSLQALINRAGTDLQVATQVYTALNDKTVLLNEVATNFQTLIGIVNPIIANLNLAAAANTNTLFGSKANVAVANAPVAKVALR